MPTRRASILRKRFLVSLYDLYQPQQASVNHCQLYEKPFPQILVAALAWQPEKFGGKVWKTVEIGFLDRYML